MSETNTQRLREVYPDRQPPSGVVRAYVFSSFDLVNSTSYKNRESDTWPETTQRFYLRVERSIENHLKDDDALRPQVWKYIGDEVVLHTAVYSAAEVARVVEITAEACTVLHQEFSQKDPQPFPRSV